MRYLLVEGITDVMFIKYVCFKNNIIYNFNDFKKVYAYTMYSQKGENLHKPQDSFMYKKDSQFVDTKLWHLEKDEFQPIINFILEVFKNN